MQAYSSNHSDMLYDSYVRYIHDVKGVRVHGMGYKIDDQCTANCIGVNPVEARTDKANNKGM